MPNIRPLSPELAEKSRRLYQENDSRIKMVLIKIKQWLSLQPHLKVRMDDQWLISFARSCKYSFERIKKRLECYYTLRTEYPDVFRLNKDPKDPTLNHFIQSGSVLSYNSKKNPTSPTICVARREYDYTKYSLDDALRYASLTVDICLYENDNAVITGSILILDLQKVPYSLLVQATFDFIRKLMRWAQEALPVRIRGIHLLHPPLGFQTLFDLITFFASEKLRRKLFVHETLEDLRQYVPKDSLPNEWGGTVGSFDELTAMWVEKFEKYHDWLIEDEQYYVDENLRPGKPNDDSACNVM